MIMKSGRHFTLLTGLPILALSLSGVRAEDTTIYEAVVKPILEARCVECHGEEKSKGKLRLDTPEHIQKGDETVVAGKSGDSSLIIRVSLPEDDDDVMPPKGDPLTKDQIAALTWWIDDHKASYEAKFVVADAPEAIQKLASAAPAPKAPKSKEPELPKVDPAAPELMKPLQDLGVLVLPLAQNTNLLHVESVSVAKDIGDERLALLKPLAPQLAWLYLNKTQITDAGMAHLSGLKQLRRLHLANTAITSAGVKQLEGLENLETLNIYGTKVDDSVLETLTKLPKLKKVFLYDTGVSSRVAFRFLTKNPELDLNLGWDFESLKKLDSGMTYHDAFDDKHQGAIQGGKLTYGDGPSGKSAKFDGKAFVVAGDIANFDRSHPFSLTAWVKGEPQDDGVIAARSDVSDSGRGWSVHVNKSKVAFHLVSNGPDNAIKVSVPVDMDKDTWYHVAATYDGSGKAEGVSIFVDSVAGKATVGQDNLSRPTKTYQVMHVGRRSDGAIFKGEIDDLRVYDSELSADQVGAMFDRYGHKDVPAAKEGEEAAKSDTAAASKADLVNAALVALFDAGSCCHKAHGKGAACDHPCCVKAHANGKVCLKCNPGAKGKDPAEKAS
jgi:mono/diheme cytochrome c family protein